jgi:hypothetical protein
MIRKYFYGEKRWFLTPFFSLHAIDWTCGNIHISGRIKRKKMGFLHAILRKNRKNAILQHFFAI